MSELEETTMAKMRVAIKLDNEEQPINGMILDGELMLADLSRDEVERWREYLGNRLIIAGGWCGEAQDFDGCEVRGSGLVLEANLNATEVSAVTTLLGFCRY